MSVRFAIEGSPTLTSHEATGVATLLASIGTPAATRLASKIDLAVREPVAVALDNDEKSALLAVTGEFAPDRMPGLLAQVRASLAETG